MFEEPPALHHFPEFGAPVLGLCGYSGSGKTTLIEAAIPHLIARGLSVAVVKHDSHGFSVDCAGKDSDRFFRAGATVALRGPAEQFQRRCLDASLSLEATLTDLARDHDLVLVEGHKDTNLPKLWLSNEQGALPPDEVTWVLEILPWHCERLEIFLSFISSWLPRAWEVRPLYAGLLVGGKSSRMGRPKQMLEFRGRTLAEVAATALSRALGGRSLETAESGAIRNPRLAILGAGQVPGTLQEVPRLADPPELAGPLAGLLAAHRWERRAAWILAACDHPWLSESDVKLLLERRNPGTWTVMLRQPDGRPYPTFALFEPQSLEVLERAILLRRTDDVRIGQLTGHPKTIIVPRATRGLFNVNTPAEFKLAITLAKKKTHNAVKRAHDECSQSLRLPAKEPEVKTARKEMSNDDL